MKNNKNYNPFLFQKMLSDKETTLQKFFNLEELPNDIKNLEESSKVIRKLRDKVKDAISESKDALYHHDKDSYSDTKESIMNTKDIIYDMDWEIEELDKIITQWEYSYNSLEELLIEIINKENLDLSKYSTNITKSELISYKRIKTINKLLGE